MVPTLAALKFICSRFSIRLVWVNTGSGLCSSQFRFFQVQYSLELLYRLLLKRILQLNFVKSQRFFKKYVEQSNAQYESGLNLLIPCRNFYFLFLKVMVFHIDSRNNLLFIHVQTAVKLPTDTENISKKLKWFRLQNFKNGVVQQRNL